MFVDNLRAKKLEQKDIQLLSITGLHDIIDILKAREIYKIKLKNSDKKIQQEITGGVNFEDLQDILENDYYLKPAIANGNSEKLSKEKREMKEVKLLADIS